MKKNDASQSIRIEGGLFPNSMLENIRSGKANRSAESDYKVPKGLRLRDEIARAFRMALALWKEFAILRNRNDHTETDQLANWHEQLLSRILGFEDLNRIDGFQIADRSFPINRAACDGLIPILLVGAAVEIDKSEQRFGTEGRRRSPSGLMQEYLNAKDSSLYGIVCNGSLLRLYRDNHSLTRPAYLEIDLDLMFSEELYADFALMYQLLHVSRLTPGQNGSDTCILELWREEALETGERAVANLRIGVTAALEVLGQGFLSHPDNRELRAAIESQKLSVHNFQLQLLRLVYRIIFLFTAEDRGLLLDSEAPLEIKKRYLDAYSIDILREKALKRLRQDDYSDCWNQLTLVFSSLAKGEIELALPALGGLFAQDQCADLDNASISNRSLLTAIYHLSFFRQGNSLTRINYRDMDSEELGSVYESLLELVPQIGFETRPWRFYYAGNNDETKGNARKLTGSYYTPDSLVKELIKSALEPVIKNTLDTHPSDPKNALLNLKVIDPACGSGHFLLAAARRIAGELAHIEAYPDQPTDKQYRHALRQVISHCIYGVDLNPMAIELARTALWLEALEPGKPLSFLDAHIRCGNALVGVLDPNAVEKGIPDDAFKPLSGDDKSVCAALRKENKKHREILEQKSEKVIATNLFEDVKEEELPVFDLSDMPEETLADVKYKELRYKEFLESTALQKRRLIEDCYTAAFFAAKTKSLQKSIPTSECILKLRGGISLQQDIIDLVRETAAKYRFFNWQIEFPEVFKKGGFDCVLGNPPWEVSQLSEEEFFASRMPSISLLTGVIRKNAIEELKKSQPSLWNEYIEEKASFEGTNNFFRESRRFEKTAVGKVNVYSLFAELASQLVSETGRSGIIVPSGIATDDSTKDFFANVSQNGQLVSLIDFENREAIFKCVHRSYKFCCLTLGRCREARFSFFLTNITQINDKRRQFTLSGADIALLNPNTKTCPVFRSQYDAELTKKIYRAAPVLIDENRPDGNPWGIRFSQGLFNMASDSHLFFTREKLEKMGGELNGAIFTAGNDTYLPLYEAKMVHQYDHRWATYESDGENTRDMTIEEKRNLRFFALPRYWVHQKHVDEALKAKNWNYKWLLGWRDVTNATNERTVIAGVIPIVAVGHTLPCYFFSMENNVKIPAFIANNNSFVLDFIARQKVGGIHLTYGYLKQLPVLPPSKYSDFDIAFITPRVLELTYTAYDLTFFARDLGYEGGPFTFDPDRRAILRAELDAYYARLYGLTRDELRYILDPADLLGDDYPSETFRVLKNKEIAEFGEYRTRRLVIEAWDKLERGELQSKHLNSNTCEGILNLRLNSY